MASDQLAFTETLVVVAEIPLTVIQSEYTVLLLAEVEDDAHVLLEQICTLPVLVPPIVPVND